MLKSIILVSIVVVAVSEAARMSLEAKQQFCATNPGATFHDGCNGCSCAMDMSGNSVCTMLPCPEHMEMNSVPSQEIPAKPNCVGYANVQWTDGCNTCSCSSDPMNPDAACTRRGCHPSMRVSWKPV